MTIWTLLFIFGLNFSFAQSQIYSFSCDVPDYKKRASDSDGNNVYDWNSICQSNIPASKFGELRTFFKEKATNIDFNKQDTVALKIEGEKHFDPHSKRQSIIEGNYFSCQTSYAAKFDTKAKDKTKTPIPGKLAHFTGSLDLCENGDTFYFIDDSSQYADKDSDSDTLRLKKYVLEVKVEKGSNNTLLFSYRQRWNIDLPPGIDLFSGVFRSKTAPGVAADRDAFLAGLNAFVSMDSTESPVQTASSK